MGHTRRRRPRPEGQPLTSLPTNDGTVPPGAGGEVWVNTRSGKYFHTGSAYYGHTKQGEYLTEDQAQKQGYTAARGQ